MILPSSLQTYQLAQFSASSVFKGNRGRDNVSLLDNSLKARSSSFSSSKQPPQLYSCTRSQSVLAFTSQFALTLELASFFPPIKWAVTTAGDAIMSHARGLRQSGSDIAVEEDLANGFGRCKISSRLASSFKTVVAQSTSNVSLLEGIMLQGGPGPTDARAFKDQHTLPWSFSSPGPSTADS